MHDVVRWRSRPRRAQMLIRCQFVFGQWTEEQHLMFLGSGCGSVGIAVASDTRGSQFNGVICKMTTVDCWKDENKEKRGWETAIFNIRRLTLDSCITFHIRLPPPISCNCNLTVFSCFLNFHHLFLFCSQFLVIILSVGYRMNFSTFLLPCSYFVNFTIVLLFDLSNSVCRCQCDQIWRFIGLWATF